MNLIIDKIELTIDIMAFGLILLVPFDSESVPLLVSTANSSVEIVLDAIEAVDILLVSY